MIAVSFDVDSRLSVVTGMTEFSVCWLMNGSKNELNVVGSVVAIVNTTDCKEP